MSELDLPASVVSKPPGTLAAIAVGNEVVLYVREDPWGLRKYPLHDCPVELRLGTWEIEPVLLTALVLRIARSDLTTFDCHIDVATPPAVRLLQCLAAQQRIDIHIVTELGTRTFRIPNPLAREADQLLSRIRLRKAWPPEAYEQALARLNKLYPTPPALWRSCLEQAGQT